MNKRCVLILFTLLMLALPGTAQEAPPKLQVSGDRVRAFVKSLILPGWGQWSNGDKLKATTFFVAEVASIAGYQINYDNGLTATSNYKDFAHDHWSYQQWLAENGGDVEDTACGNLRTHAMPTYEDDGGLVQPIMNHHYYENIGKYPEFKCGWDDIDDEYLDENGHLYTPNKATYIQMRLDANDLYKQARLAGTLIMINHLVSAFDAAWGADITSFESAHAQGKFYIHPLSPMETVKLEVRF